MKFELAAEGIEVFEDEMKAYYDRNRERFAADEGEEAGYKPFEDVRAEINELLSRQKALSRARRKAEDTILNLEEGYSYWNDLDREQTDYFGKSEDSINYRVIQAAFRTEPGKVSSIVEAPDALYILKVTGLRPSYIPENHAAVKEKVINRVREIEAGKMASGKAEEFLNRLRESDDFRATSSFFNKTIEQPGYFSRDAAVQGLGKADEFTRISFTMNELHPFAAAPVPDGTAVINFIGRKPIEPEKFEEEKERFRQYVELDKRQRILNDWFALLQTETGARFFLREDSPAIPQPTSFR